MQWGHMSAVHEFHQRIEGDGTPLYEGALAGRDSERDGASPRTRTAGLGERFPTLDDGIDSMLKAGVLRLDDAGAYCSPIPSLAYFALTSDDPAPSGGTSGPPVAGRTHSPAPG